jgi:transposase
MPGVGSQAMTLHLAEIGQQVSAEAHAVLVCDGAGWHQTGERLSVPANLSLLRLPPYAPELNPLENVWEYLRGNQLSMRVWESYDAIVEACCEAWNGLVGDAARIASITTRDWASVKI